jgi:hypothetical protein
VGTKEGEKSVASGSPSEWMTVAMEESGGVPSLSVTVGGQEASTEGAVEERAWQSGVDEGDKAKKGNGGGRRLLWRPGGAGGEEKGLGVWGLAPRGGENGAERGGPRRGGKQLGWPASAPSWRARVAPLPCDRRGRRGASDAGVSGGQAGPGDVGPGGQRLGAGGSERERGSGGVRC